MSKKEKACCSEFSRANRAGSDSEGYGSLIFKIGEQEHLMGVGLDPIEFCPWCGKKLESTEHE